MRQFLLPGFRGVVLALVVAAGFAAAPRVAAAQGAEAFVSNLGNEALQVLGPSVPAGVRASRFRQLFNSDFDLPGIAQFVLGVHARALAPQQQQEFLSVFREYLVQSYSARLSHYAGAQLRVTGTRPYGGEVIVTSQVVPRGGNPVEIDWHVMDHGGRFLITDVSVDGVSMKANQRQEFAAIIQRNGGHPGSLIAALRQQVGQEAGYGSSR